MRAYKIYKLLNSETSDVFYVGITSQSLYNRLKNHILSSINGSTEVSVYISKLKTAPLISLIEETDDTRREYFWINYYSERYELCNWQGNNKKRLELLTIFNSLHLYNKTTISRKNFRRFIYGADGAITEQQKLELIKVIKENTAKVIEYIETSIEVVKD